jgi:hypothetical protein
MLGAQTKKVSHRPPSTSLELKGSQRVLAADLILGVVRRHAVALGNKQTTHITPTLQSMRHGWLWQRGAIHTGGVIGEVEAASRRCGGVTGTAHRHQSADDGGGGQPAVIAIPAEAATTEKTRSLRLRIIAISIEFTDMAG